MTFVFIEEPSGKVTIVSDTEAVLSCASLINNSGVRT